MRNEDMNNIFLPLRAILHLKSVDWITDMK